MSAFTGRHVMVDLVTMSLGKDAAIVQVGAVAFYPEEGRVSLTERLNVHVRLGSSLAMGRSLDPATLLWWMRQSDGARRAFVDGQEKALDLPPALLELASFTRRANGRRGLGAREEAPDGVWSHGLPFDVAVLEDAFAKSGLKCPWDYRRCFDTRTIFAASDQLVGTGRGTDRWEPDAQSHVAVSDAVEQAYDLLMALHALDWGPDVQRFDPDAGLPTATELHPQ